MDLVSDFSFLLRGGFMMYPLLISAFISIVVIIERLWFLKVRFFTPHAEVRALLNGLQAGPLNENAKIEGNQRSPVVNVLQAGLSNLRAPAVDIESRMQTEAELWMPVIEKRLEILDTIVTAAPLMGLLGTITGMMASFKGLSEKGVSDPGAITGGVSEALIATATGLVIALVTLIAYNYFNQVVRTTVADMESSASQFLDIVKRLKREPK